MFLSSRQLDVPVFTVICHLVWQSISLFWVTCWQNTHILHLFSYLGSWDTGTVSISFYALTQENSCLPSCISLSSKFVLVITNAKLGPSTRKNLAFKFFIYFKTLNFSPGETIHLVWSGPALNWSHCRVGTTTPNHSSVTLIGCKKYHLLFLKKLI